MSRILNSPRMLIANLIAGVLITTAAAGTATAATVPIVTNQAHAARAAFLAYAPAPAGAVKALCLVDSGVNATRDTMPGLVSASALDGGTGADVDPLMHGTNDAVIAGGAGYTHIGAWPQLKIVSIRATDIPQPGKTAHVPVRRLHQRDRGLLHPGSGCGGGRDRPASLIGHSADARPDGGIQQRGRPCEDEGDLDSRRSGERARGDPVARQPAGDPASRRRRPGQRRLPVLGDDRPDVLRARVRHPSARRAGPVDLLRQWHLAGQRVRRCCPRGTALLCADAERAGRGAVAAYERQARAPRRHWHVRGRGSR